MSVGPLAAAGEAVTEAMTDGKLGNIYRFAWWYWNMIGNPGWWP